MTQTQLPIFLYNKNNRRTNFPNLFCQKTLNISGSSSAHHQEFSTVHSALVCVIKPTWLSPCRMYRGKLLIMGGGTARNM